MRSCKLQGHRHHQSLQGPLDRQPCLDMLYPIRSAGSLQSPSVRILYSTELVRKIHAAGFSTRSMSQDPAQDSRQEPCVWSLGRVLVQDPCVRISAGPMTAGPLEDPCLRTICVSRSSRRSMPVDPCLRFHTCESSTRCIVSPDLYVSASLSVGPLQDPCLRIHYKIRGSGSSARSMSPDPL